MKRSILRLLPVLMLLAAAIPAEAELQTSTVRYNDGDLQLQGYFYWDDIFKGKRPGVMVVHEWWGLNDYVRKRAEMLAKEAGNVSAPGSETVVDSAWNQHLHDGPSGPAVLPRILVSLMHVLE